MSQLAPFVLGLILSLARAPAVDLSDTGEFYRLQQTAEDVAAAAEAADGYPFRGEARVEALAIALVALATHESAFSARVATCRVTGDRMPWHKPWEGYSITLWQLRAGRAWAGHRRREICQDGALAARLAAGVLGLHGRSGSVGGFFRGYASGDSGVDSKAARARCATWSRLAKGAGIDGADCWRSGAVSYLPPLDR